MNRQAPPPPAAEGAFLAAWRHQLQTALVKPWLARPWLTHSRDLLQRFTRTYDHLSQQPRHVRRRIQRQWGASLAGAALALALLNAPAYAGPPTGITVDGTTCTLVDAITAANTDAATNGCDAGSGADTITLSGDVTLTGANTNVYNNATGLPVITTQITIEGADHTISRAATAPHFRLLAVGASGDLTVHQVTLTGGDAKYYGGGLYNKGTVTVSNSTLSGNSASIGGAGLYNKGTVTVSNSTLSGNSANRGGGIANATNGTVTVSNSTLSGNTALRGGGIFNQGTVTVSNSTLSGNTAGNGGGIYGHGALTLEYSLISGNTATSGQEVFNSLGDCLNAAGTNAIACAASVSAINTTSPNLFGYSGLTNAQAFYNFTPDVNDITATSDGTHPTALAAILNTTLANNGGGTLTHALVTGSPAIDAAGGSALIATDQRGVTRPQGAADDIGAFELEKVNANLGLQGTTTTFNVNPATDFEAQSTAGVFTITATFRNTASPAVNLHDVAFVVTQIHYNNGDNYLLSADNPPGQVGATQSVANSAFGGDNLWNQNEDLQTTFRIGLMERRRFAFFVDVYGISSAVTAAGASTTPHLIGHFTFTVDPNEADGQGRTLFLPLVAR